MKPISNKVLLKINKDNSQIKLENGIILWIDTSYSVGRHQNINCTVVAIPDKLIFGDDFDYYQSMPHHTDMELLPGDEVIVRYLSVFEAFDNNQPRHFIDEETGEEYFFVDYKDIYVAKREWTKTEIEVFNKSRPEYYDVQELEKQNIIIINGKFYSVIPLNGCVISKPLSVELKTKLIIPDYLKKKADKTVCIAAFVGKPNKAYWHSDMCDDPRLKSGDKIIIEKNCDIPLEPEEHLTFYGDKLFWRVSRENIVGIISE